MREVVLVASTCETSRFRSDRAQGGALRIVGNHTGSPPPRLLFDNIGNEQNETIYEAFHVLNTEDQVMKLVDIG